MRGRRLPTGPAPPPAGFAVRRDAYVSEHVRQRPRKEGRPARSREAVPGEEEGRGAEGEGVGVLAAGEAAEQHARESFPAGERRRPPLRDAVRWRLRHPAVASSDVGTAVAVEVREGELCEVGGEL